MKKFTLVCVLISVFLSISFAQDSRLAINVVSFKNLSDDNGNYTELYYSIPYSKLVFTEIENVQAAMFDISFKVRDTKGNDIINNTSKQGIQKASGTIQSKKLKINEIIKFYIQPGFYTFEFEMSGKGLDSDLYYNGEFTIPEYSDTELQLSQIEICSNISTDTNVEKYVKNNLMVYPNPSKVFERTRAVIFFYSELYNLEFDKNDSTEQNYTLSYLILNSDGDTVKTYPDIKNKKGGRTSVIANYLNLRKFESGNYTLVLNARDDATMQSAQQKETFTLENIPYITEEFASTFRQMVSYIASETEMDIFDELNLIGKQSFIEQFWKRRDPTPDTPENEFKMVYYQRWEFVKMRYTNESPGLEGWETDRGRIYLKFGAPTDVDRIVGNIRFRDHEIWYYESERFSSKMFVFADTHMRGRYFLIHSEAPDQNEVYNPNWRSSISTR